MEHAARAEEVGIQVKVTFKTWDEFKSKGFKQDWNRCYAGDKRSPDASFKTSWISTHLGKSFELLNIEPVDGEVEILCYGRHASFPFWMFTDENILKKRVKNLVRLKLPGTRKTATYIPGGNFVFPCEFSELTSENGVKLARWILKNAKAKR